MSEFPTTARVVIIGGGVVGVSTLYHLAKAGWTDCVLLEKNELTAGSTWHAAGNCPSFSTSWAIMNMQRYSLGFTRAGRRGRLSDELPRHRLHPPGPFQRTDARIRTRARYGQLSGSQHRDDVDCGYERAYPFLETHDLVGGLWDPDDGDIDPAQLTQALAKGARRLGAKIERFCPATGVSRENGEWIVHTEKGDIRCEKVVNAAGYYAQRVGEWFKPYGGRTVPMATMSHQYFLTEEIPELKEWTEATGHKVPLLRDVDSSYYLRQDKNGLNLGPYERNCKGHWMTPRDPMPDDFSFQLYPDDLERLEWYIEDAMARVPILGTAGVGRVINGPIPYAPDGLPLMGPMPGVPNAYEACVFTFGITQGGGAGKVMAEWITEGKPSGICGPSIRAATPITPIRITATARHGGLTATNTRCTSRITHGLRRATKSCPPVHDKVIAQGGVMGAYNGWERANWYARDGDDTSEEATQTWDRVWPMAAAHQGRMRSGARRRWHPRSARLSRATNSTVKAPRNSCVTMARAASQRSAASV